MPDQPQPYRMYWCDAHQIAGTGRCPRCAEAAQRREQIATLEARVADLEADLLDARRRMSALEQRQNDAQRAHNALAATVEKQEQSG